MKKTFLVLLGAALLVVAGCKKDDNKDNNANGEKMTFTSNFGGGAKTAINEKEMTWTTGDQIIINGETFDSEIFDEGRLAKFTGNVVEPVYQAFYPIGIYKGENSYELPATQTYSGNTLSGVNPMYARSTSTSLDFHNICALVKLDLTGTGIVTRIVAAADQPLSGAFSIAGDETNGYYAQLDSKDAAATVTLDCSNSVVQLDATTPTTFYMALPQGDFTNLTFTVENDKGMTAIAKQLALCPLQAGHLSNEVAQVAFVPAGALPGVFSVSATKKVHFSQGNLYYDGSKFQFEANQYYTPSSWSTDHISHFYWSKFAEVACALSYSESGTSSSDVFFTNENETTANASFKVNVESKEQSGWRTLSNAEWKYLLETSARMVNGKPCYSKAFGVTIESVTYNGVFVYPDNYNGDIVSSSMTWDDIHAAGIAFFPAAGNRENYVVDRVGNNGSYSSSSAYDSDGAIRMFFSATMFEGNNYVDRSLGISVRLVIDVE